jgi:Mitochondrial carrier protein
MLISLLLYPLDTAKRLLQLNGGRGSLAQYRSTLDVFTKTAATPAAFYRGAHLFFLKELICAFAQVSIYESLSPQTFGLP